MSIQFDARQIEYRNVLQQLFPWVSGQALDILLESINSDVTSPLKVDATAIPGLTVNVGPAIVINPISNRNRSISPINNLLPVFLSGTITFPSTDGGNITTSTGGSYVLTLPSNEYALALLELDETGHLIVNMGVADPVEANALLPTATINTLPFAYITLFNNAGTIQNIAQDNIFQFAGAGGGGGGSGGGVAEEVALTIGTTSIAVTFPTPQATATYVVLTQIVDQTDPNPEYIPVTITNKLTTGFTASWNTPIPTSSYDLDYIVPPGITQQQIGETAVPMGSTSITTTIPLSLGSTSYVVIAELVDTTDSVVQYQPVTVTAKTNTTFTVSWNAPTSTNNYLIAWQMAAYQS